MKITSISSVPYKEGHKGFPGLGYHSGKYYLAFRHARSHMSHYSETAVKFVVLESDNLKDWHENMVHSEVLDGGWNYDYRDSFMKTINGKLAFFSIVSKVKNDLRENHSELRWLNPATGTFEKDEGFSLPGCSIWNCTMQNDKALSMAYHKDEDRNYTLKLLQSADCGNWELADTGLEGSEADLHELADGRLLCFARQEKVPYHMKVFVRNNSEKKWDKVLTIPKIIQCPLAFESDGEIYLLGRERPDYIETADSKNPSFDQHRLKLFKFDMVNGLEEVLEFPSKGDCGYPGIMFEPNGTILVAYYSQHESVIGKNTSSWTEPDWLGTPTSLFIARLEK